MDIEIVEQPIRFQLYGFGGRAEKQNVPAVGMQLMNQMWQAIKSTGIASKGTNHWVYLPDGRMLVGVELVDGQPPPAPQLLIPLTCELKRYLKHLHIGPYQALPQKWSDLKAEIAARGEVIGSPSLEIYGHYCEDAAKLETTILIGL